MQALWLQAHTAALIISLALPSAFAHSGERIKRDPSQRLAFVKMNPCPATGKTRGRCPGWVVDHIIALKHGGPDRPDNMQWQTIEEAKHKDRWE
jgi:hypothetical protein